jgi:selenide,water dikinase
MQKVGQADMWDVVLVGAGHAHVEVLRQFGERPPLPGLRLTLITPDVHTPYSGMLPGLVNGRYRFEEAHIDTGPLARFAGAGVHYRAAVGIDPERRQVICDHGPPVPYDVLSIDIGSTPNTAAVRGAGDHALAVKPIGRFLERLAALRGRLEARDWRSRIAVVGGGAGGVELILSLEAGLRRQAALAGRDPAGLSFTLVSGVDALLPDFPAGVRRGFHEILARRGIAVLTGAWVARVLAHGLEMKDGASLPAEEVLWVTEAQPPAWLQSSGLALDDRGFIKVGETLQAEGLDRVFAAGDVIAFGPRSLPKSGVYAVRAGPVLAENIRRLLTGERLTAYRPQRHAMYLISTGEDYAVGVRNGLVFAGRWVWRWKDRIDRRFMARYQNLPEAAAEAAGQAAAGANAARPPASPR